MTHKTSPEAGDFSIMIDREICILSSPQMDKLSGFPIEGQPIENIFSPETSKLISTALAGEYIALLRARLKNRTDSQHCIIWPESEGVWRITMPPDSLFTDLSQARLNLLSRRLKDQLSFFFGSLNLLSHSLKNDNSAKASSHLALMLQNSYRLERLTENLVLLTSSEDQSGFSPAAADIPMACRAVFESCEVHLESHDLKLSFSAPGKPVYISFDQTDLERMIFNLVSNSIRHNPPGTEVSIKVEPANKGAVISVADNGRGIDPAIIKIALGFGASESKKSESAFGLGLMVAHKAVRRHNGNMYILTKPGETIVSIHLPGIENTRDELPFRHPPVDYAGGLDHTLIELSDILSPDEFLDR